MAARIAASQRVWDDDERDTDFTETLSLGLDVVTEDDPEGPVPPSSLVYGRSHARIHPEAGEAQHLSVRVAETRRYEPSAPGYYLS